MSKLGDKDFENFIEEYKFTIRTQQQMIDELINKIDKAIDYINTWILDEYSIAVMDKEDDCCVYEPEAKERLLEMLGVKENVNK